MVKRILSLYSGHSPERPALIKRLKLPLEYIAIRHRYPGRLENQMNAPDVINLTGYSESFKIAQLNLALPSELGEKLDELAPGYFDEIHLHAPSGPEFENATPASLKVIAQKLKPGGRFYHSFEKSSPVIGVQDNDKYDSNLERVKTHAKAAGLKVDNFAQKTGELYATLSGVRKNPHIVAAIRRYTDYPKYASNFVVFKKI